MDMPGSLAEVEMFYMSVLTVYCAQTLSDDNVRIAIDSLGKCKVDLFVTTIYSVHTCPLISLTVFSYTGCFESP